MDVAEMCVPVDARKRVCDGRRRNVCPGRFLEACVPGLCGRVLASFRRPEREPERSVVNVAQRRNASEPKKEEGTCKRQR